MVAQSFKHIFMPFTQMDTAPQSQQPLLSDYLAAYWSWAAYYDYTLHSFNQNIEVLFGETDRYRVVAFRGSDEIDNWLDNNLNIRPATMHSGMKVQAGYLNAFSGVYYPLVETIGKSDHNLPLYCVGHSLGAAVAGICADVFDADGYITFGSPRFACPNYAEHLANKLSFQKRFAFWNDPVQYTTNPYRYRHTYPVTWLKYSSWCPLFPHNIELYVTALSKRI